MASICRNHWEFVLAQGLAVDFGAVCLILFVYMRYLTVLGFLLVFCFCSKDWVLKNVRFRKRKILLGSLYRDP